MLVQMVKDIGFSVIFQMGRRLHTWCNRYEVPLLLLTLLLLLRIPNLAEPYWYGDEAIYLTIGTGLRHGLLLYRDIVDHKTPIIYWLAMTPTQIWFRWLLIGWTGFSTVVLWDGLRRWISNRTAALAALGFVVFSSLPALEGNIPNGELFVSGFIVVALWLLIRSQAARGRLKAVFLLTAGLMAGLGILTKVPAILDAGALAAWFWFWSLEKKKFSLKLWWPILPFGFGVIIAIVSSIFYFTWRGTLSDYLQFGLLYNLHYSQTWRLSFAQPIWSQLFSLPGKTIILGLLLVLTSLLTWMKKVPAQLSWSIFWIAAAFFAALLSNRPYPHYLLQVVLPLSISLALFFETKISLRQRFVALFPWLLLNIVLVGALALLSFRPYPQIEYYVRFWRFFTGKIGREEYDQSFNQLIGQNNQLATIIRRNSGETDRIFIWGTNPMLYALAQRSPASRFTVAFHIHDLKAYDSTLAEVKQNRPVFIVILKSESALPGLIEYLQGNYFLAETTTDMLLYRRSNQNNEMLLQ